MKNRYENGVITDIASEARVALAHELRATRKNLNITQQDLADLAGTKKSNISRLESGKYNPSLDFIVKVANCMGKKVDINIK